jgi:DNA-directed RNA polymerase subunit RPC12/RpoP
MGRPNKHGVKQYAGLTFYKKPNGYWKQDHKLGGRYLHRFVWETERGPIPPGYCIHHKDGNKDDNSIENLSLLSFSLHAKYHNQKNRRENPEKMAKGIEAAREAARIWHGSEEGRKWHSEHGKRTWLNREKEERVCVQCGKKYEVFKGITKRGFCSPACQSAARRDSGVDDVERICAWCGKPFTINKYRKTRVCCKLCQNKLFSKEHTNT